MRRCRTALALLTIALISVIPLLLAGPATAGGPTSVLLVVPGTGRTASLYTGSADYEELAGLVGVFADPADEGSVDRSGAGHEAGTGVTLTWLIHDVQVWRVDRVYVGADGRPWISTQAALDGSSSIWDSAVTWDAAADGASLVALLDRLGVGPDPVAGGTDARATPGMSTVVGEPAVTSGPAVAGGPALPRGREGPAWNRGPVWALAGLVVGAALTVAALSLRSGSASRGWMWRRPRGARVG